MTFRVIQWATGGVGCAAIEAIVSHPDLELVGVVVHGESKGGRDAGERAREAPPGAARPTDGGRRPAPTGVVLRGPGGLAAAVAARLVTRLGDVQTQRERASLVLAGGTIGIAARAALRAPTARTAVDWPRVEVWWGEGGFVGV